MNILMPCKLRSDALRAAKELLEAHGHRCTLYAWESAAKLRERVRTGSFDTLLCAESAVLPRSGLPLRTVFLAPDFFCAHKFPPTGVTRCLIAHEDLSFDFITHGVRDASVRVCGVPLSSSLRSVGSRGQSCTSLGLREDRPVFLVVGDTLSLGVLKSFVSSVQTFCREAQILLLGGGAVRRKSWMSAFSENRNVFVSEAKSAFSLGLGAADAVFTPAFSPFVCAAARQEKPLALLHSAVPRTRKNADFLDSHGVAFHAQSTADGVSYICRLLDSDRLRANMLHAQQRCILPDAEARFLCAAQE
ncbi:MAG: hypothetical protein IJT44_04330 [Clostridia bacterium]|nr:hypothetical protein [Clostridia bacterium]